MLQLIGLIIFSHVAEDAELYFDIKNILMIFLCAALITSVGLFLEQLFSEPGAIMSQIILSIAMLFLCGAILPAAFLPGPISALGSAMPYAPLHRSLAYFLNGSSADPELLPLALWSAGLFAASWVIFKIRKETY